MGAACNCSKSIKNVKDTIPNTVPSPPGTTQGDIKPPVSKKGVPLEAQLQALAAYRSTNQAAFHKKITEMFNQVQGELLKGVAALKLNTMKMKEKDWEHFLYLLEYCEKLRRLHLWKVTIKQSELNLFSAHLMLFDQLEYLMLGDMNLGSLALNLLGETFKKLTRVKELILTVNYLNSEHLGQLVPGILHMQNLELISLDENELGNRGAELTAELIIKLPRLTDVSVKFNSIGTKGLMVMLPLASKRPGMIIRLDGNDLNDDEYDMLEEAHRNQHH